MLQEIIIICHVIPWTLYPCQSYFKINEIAFKSQGEKKRQECHTIRFPKQRTYIHTYISLFEVLSVSPKQLMVKKNVVSLLLLSLKKEYSLALVV